MVDDSPTQRAESVCHGTSGVARDRAPKPFLPLLLVVFFCAATAGVTGLAQATLLAVPVLAAVTPELTVLHVLLATSPLPTP